MSRPADDPDCFTCSISVSMCLTICFCLACVSSPESGLPSRFSTSRISLIISPIGPLRSPSSPLGRFRFRPASCSSRSSISLSLPPSLARSLLAAPCPLRHLAAARRLPSRPLFRRRFVLALPQLAQQIVECLVLGRKRRRLPRLACRATPSLSRRAGLAGPRARPAPSFDFCPDPDPSEDDFARAGSAFLAAFFAAPGSSFFKSSSNESSAASLLLPGSWACAQPSQRKAQVPPRRPVEWTSQS